VDIDELRRRAAIYRRSLVAAGQAQERSRTWRALRVGPNSPRRELRWGMVVWLAVVVAGMGGMATVTRWGITLGVIAVMVGGRQVLRIRRFLGRTRQ